MSYKIGDKVRIRCNLKHDTRYGNNVFIYPMRDYMGKETKVKGKGAEKPDYTLEIDDGEYGWTDDMLDPVEQETNMEHYINEIAECIDMDCERFEDICRGHCYNACDGCPLWDRESILKWLKDPYVEPKPKIKLKKWEYDLLRTTDQPHSRTLESFSTYRSLKLNKHFEGIDDMSMTIEQVLRNCEVVD